MRAGARAASAGLAGWPLLASVGAHVAGLVAASAAAVAHPVPAPVLVPIELVRVEPPPPPPPPPRVAPRPRAPRPLPPPPKPVAPPPEPEPVAQRPPPEPVEQPAVLPPAPPPALLSDEPPREATPRAPAPAAPELRRLASAAAPRSLAPSAPVGPPPGAGALFSTGDLPVTPGPGTRGLRSSERGRGDSASGSGPADGARTPGPGGPQTAALDPGAGLTAFARPVGGYQTTPRYPESARRQGIEGVATLRFVVLATGRVGQIVVAHSAGHPDLDRAAVDAVKTWRFEPARRGKEPVPVWVTLPVRFELRTD